MKRTTTYLLFALPVGLLNNPSVSLLVSQSASQPPSHLGHILCTFMLEINISAHANDIFCELGRNFNIKVKERKGGGTCHIMSWTERCWKSRENDLFMSKLIYSPYHRESSSSYNSEKNELPVNQKLFYHISPINY